MNLTPCLKCSDRFEYNTNAELTTVSSTDGLKTKYGGTNLELFLLVVEITTSGRGMRYWRYNSS